jgi:hypothetical protein
MARIRSIKSDLFMDDGLAEVSLEAHFLLAGLPCIADSEGRLEDRPRRIKAQVFPYRDADVDRCLDELARSGYVRRYEADGGRYIQVSNWERDQGPQLPERRRVRVRPELAEWYAENPGGPPPAVDLGPPLVRLRTPAERVQYQAEQAVRDAQLRAEREERQRLARRRWVYFIQAEAGGPIKIGISRDVERRRGELQRAERQALKVLATFEGTIQDESAMHTRFAAHRLHGEWFSPAPDLLSHIAALNGVKS